MTSSPDPTQPDHDPAAARRATVARVASLPPYFACAGLLTWYGAGALSRLGTPPIGELPSGGLEFGPPFACWLLVAFFPSLVLGMVPVMLAARLVMGAERFDEVIADDERKLRMSGVKVMASLLAVTLGGAALACWLFAGWSLRCDVEAITVDPLWGEPRRYVHAELDRVEWVTRWRAPNGNRISDKPFVRLVFRDGWSWDSYALLDAGSASGRLRMQRLAGWLEQRGRPPVEVDEG